jgi:hypothetical protein
MRKEKNQSVSFDVNTIVPLRITETCNLEKITTDLNLEKSGAELEGQNTKKKLFLLQKSLENYYIL